MNIAIIGLGYVGLPLCLQFARSGVRVLGLDIDSKKVRALNAGRSYIKHIDAGEIKKFVEAENFLASTDFAGIAGVGAQSKTISEPPYVGCYGDKIEAILICVPTPLKKNRAPDLSYVLQTGRSIAPYLQRGQLVVLESTTYPGTTENELRAVLERGSGLKAGVDFHLAFSPEREDPGNPKSKVAEIPKVIGGYTPACLTAAVKVYSRAIRVLIPVANCRTAEAAKLLENVFRSVNIALVNELKGVYAAMDIDVWDVIAAARTKPFGFMPFYPGPGLGGHCIPIDPFYLAWKAKQVGQETRFVELAGEINRAMPEKVVATVGKALASQKKKLRGALVLVLGLAYKANVEDDRESPSYKLLDLLAARGATVAYHDPFVPVIKPTREHPHWAGTKSVKWSRAVISKFDAVLISTAHEAVDYQQLADWARVIVDTRNVMAGVRVGKGRVWKG
ncbi:MAG TPA: nucleotide sugar dehydrogenase [Verrucomicrobiae bacterium]|nr:nucleotide sugar dehydrogenase [Verrucomicrobiae bacterium]